MPRPQPLRVMIAAEHAAVGAAETYAFLLAGGLAQRGHEVRLLVFPEIVDAACRHINDPTVKVFAVSQDSVRRLREARNHIQAAAPHVVHVNHSASPVLISAGTLGVPVRAITDHVLPVTPRYNLRGSLLASATRRAVNLLVVFSHQNAGEATRNWPRLPATVIYPGVPEHRCDEDPATTRARLRIPQDRFVACMVGRLSEEKRFDVFVRAIARVRCAGARVHGLAVGSGPEHASLDALARSLGIEHAFTFTGHRRDVPCLLAASDLYVQCSSREGIGFALLEAMAAGLPVIVTDVAAFAEAAGKGEVPVVPVGDHEALALAMSDICRRPDRVEAIGMFLRERWRRQFTVDRMVVDHETAYSTALESGYHGLGSPPPLEGRPWREDAPESS